MALAADADDERIDLDRVDMMRAVLQRRGDVRAGAGPEDQHVIERVAEHRIRPLIEVFLVVDGRHRLVKDVVDLDDGIFPLLADRDLVVRGPEGVAAHHVDEIEAASRAERWQAQSMTGPGDRPTPPVPD